MYCKRKTRYCILHAAARGGDDIIQRKEALAEAGKEGRWTFYSYFFKKGVMKKKSGRKWSAENRFFNMQCHPFSLTELIETAAGHC